MRLQADSNQGIRILQTNTVPSSIGQDGSLSRCKGGFDSRRDHHNLQQIFSGFTCRILFCSQKKYILIIDTGFNGLKPLQQVGKFRNFLVNFR